MSLTTQALDRGQAGEAAETFGDLESRIWAVRDGTVVAWSIPGERWAEGQPSEEAAKDRFASVVKKLSRRSDLVSATPPDETAEDEDVEDEPQVGAPTEEEDVEDERVTLVDDDGDE